MKIIAIALSSLLVVALAHAASFDCAKAQSKVEHMICDDSELSKLDEELGSRYKAALQSQSNVSNIEGAQREWLRQRDACVNSACIEKLYRKRIGQMNSTQSTTAQARAAKLHHARRPERPALPANRFPPYPEVWGYEFPSLENQQRGLQLDVQASGNGDFAVSYLTSLGVKNGKIDSGDNGLLFFSGKPLHGLELKKFRDKSYLRDNDALSNSIEIDDDTSWERILTIDFCRPFSKYRMGKYENRPRKLIEERSILYYVERPVHTYYDHDAYRQCEVKAGWREFPEKFYEAHVFAVLPGLVPLDDNTFLLYDQLGNFILRFDKDFKSRSPLVNQTVFVVETQDIVAIEKALLDSNRFDLQTYDAAVANYLEQLKNGAPREGALKKAITKIH